MDDDYVGLINGMLARAATWCAWYTLMRWHLGYDLDDLYLEVNNDGSQYDLLAVSQDGAPVPHCIKIELSDLFAEETLALLDTPSERMLPPEYEARPQCLAQVKAVFQRHTALGSRLSAVVYRRFMDAAGPDGLLEDVEVAISHADLRAVIHQWHEARRKLVVV